MDEHIVLWRGIKSTSDRLCDQTSPEHRRDEHMHPAIQHYVDRYLITKNCAAQRFNSIFCTSNREQAAQYGTIFQILPKEGFVFSYFVGVHDLYLHLENWLYRLDYRDVPKKAQRIFADIQHDQHVLGEYLCRAETVGIVSSVLRRHWLNCLTLHTDNLSMGLQSGAEILIRGRYDAIRC